MEQSEKKIDKKKAFRIRIWILIAVFGVGLIILLGWKLWKIMIVDHDYYAQSAVEQQTYQTKITASRGAISDRNGNVLAVSVTTYNVFISPYEILEYGESIDLIAETLGGILNLEPASIKDKNTNKDSWYEVLAYEVEQSVADEITAFKEENDIIGVHLQETFTRKYPYSSLACQIVGFTGTDGYGLYGIEQVYNKYLQGTDGYQYYMTTGEGQTISQSESTAQDGGDVQLTIDVNIQSIAEKYLAKAVTDYGVKNGGCCIIMDVDTCAILAMANCDNYDPNSPTEVSAATQEYLDTLLDDTARSEALSQAQLRQWRNYAVNADYEPGSVFKTITLAMALEDNKQSVNSTFDCGGQIDILGRDEPLHCWNRNGHGLLSLQEAVKQSCNVAFTEIGLSIGAVRFYDYVEGFGLFEKTGIDLDGETGSTWWDEEVFFNSENYSQLAAASFGQTFTITPINMITAIAAATNGGYLREPYIVSSVTDSDGNIVYAKDPTVVRQVISKETSETICSLLKNVVSDDDGTGHNAYVNGHSIAGKTGTSEKIGTITEDGYKDYVVSFGGVAPADDPAIAVLVVLDTPSGENPTDTAISGGAMAAPVASSVFADVLNYLGYRSESNVTPEE